MKINLPITDQETSFPPGRTLVSRTDTKGIITFANDAFVDVSGFSREELVGSSHNIVRHPDVPAAVFAQMWRTLKDGLPWRGVVKNRCKNGAFYWVDAQVVPVRKNGETIGYMSVRRAPAREDIPKAEAAYLEAARAGSRERRTAATDWKHLLSVKNGVVLGIVFVALMMIAGGIIGITGLQMSNNAMQSLYHDQMAPVQTLGRINFLMADNRAQAMLGLHHNPALAAAPNSDHPPAQHADALSRNIAEIDALWADYSKRPRSGAERERADRYAAARIRYVEQGLKPAQLALQQGDYGRAEALILDQVNPLYSEVNQRADDLLSFLAEQAKGNYQEVAARNQRISVVAACGILAGVLIALFSGLFFFRATVVPLQAAVVALERIAEGNLSGQSGMTGYGEPGRVMTAVTVMQLHLKVMMDEIRQSAGSIRAQCHRLNNTMMNLAQHAEEQHDRVYQALDNIALTSDGLGKLADDAGAIVEVANAPAARSPASVLETTASGSGVTDGGLPAETAPAIGQMAQQLAAAVQIEAFSLEDSVGQMHQVAALIVDSRGEVQAAWAASQQLEIAAQELDKLVQYFE
jgi:aerotaxis receptor